MEIIERASEARQMLQRKRLEDKVSDSRAEAERLRIENRALQEEARRERGELERLLEAVERLSARTNGGSSHRLRRGVTLIVAAGGAYVLGAKAGRARYAQIVDRWSRLRSKGVARIGEVQDRIVDATDRPNDLRVDEVDDDRRVSGSF